MKWKLLAFTKGVTRRLGRFNSLKWHQSHPNQTNLEKHQGHPDQMNLKKYQGHPDQMNLKKYQGHQGLLMIQARKDRSLKKHKGQAMEKRSLQRQEKKLKRPHSLKRHQSHLNLLTQVRKEKKKGYPRTIMGKKLC